MRDRGIKEVRLPGEGMSPRTRSSARPTREKQIPRTEFTYTGWAEGFHCMRDKSPAPHFKHILSEREEQSYENMAATSGREVAAQRLDYDVRLHHFEPYREHEFGLSRVYHTKLLCASTLAVYKELKELVVGAEPDFCPHAYTATASPSRELNYRGRAPSRVSRSNMS